ncbi:Acyl-[acyl-carrier-protein]--UDP-N-acetylglucosamine O-acyltransferase [bioreactor metagenome]|uniref:Acyl-[acyl-carrier-protein]--UDP-N-acetylglucosamine O-acyltransferase n=1 Tax=bioreactor metagenome TaxID=1076179 RepID=A0A645GU64_9ZZZZ
MHVAHNCRLHNAVIMANGALLGGHAEIFDRAFISGNCMVHQFTRVGTLALMQGGSAASKDVPPFTITHHINTLAGLDVVGMRRAGINSADRLELKKLYHFLYRAPDHGFRNALAAAQGQFSSGVARQVFEFLSVAKRGICMASSSRATGTQETGED